MLAGRKPLAMFYACAHELPWEELVPEEAFRPYVEAGRFSREDIEFESATPAGTPVVMRYVFYAVRGQEWRSQLMAVLVRALQSGGGWNETCERVQGTLLGYTTEENEVHCAQMFRGGAL
jgi:hypothetical protein